MQNVFGKPFNAETEFARNGCQFDRLLVDDDCFQMGGLHAQAIHTPGHTPACMTYMITDHSIDPVRTFAFVGDTLFTPDYGTAPCDFLGGDAHTLYRPTQKVLALSDSTEFYLCRDYPAAGNRAPECRTTVATQKSANVYVHEGVDEESFVAKREARDVTLAMPELIFPSVQVNVRGGLLPPPEDNGIRYLNKIPVGAL